ncbi:MAG: D-alanyl-D-alanine carboxypeptidase/D-alanyl-D-alanine endopeptidase [Thermodesulfobacteriota bacterium]
MSRAYKILLIIIAITLFPVSGLNAKNYQSQFSALIPQSARGNGKLGVYVKSLNDDRVIFHYNENKNFIPASNNKVISSYAALSLLGKDFRFKTEFYTGGEINDGTVFGGLYIKSYGDPSVTTGDLVSIVLKMKAMGIKRIKGDIYLDDTYFDNVEYANGWKNEWIGDYYCPPIAAFALNYNTVDVSVSPTKIGNSPRVNIEPESYILNINNKAVTSKHKSSLIVRLDPSGKLLNISGRINRKSGPQKFTISALEPATYYGLVFRNLLLEQGIEFDGQIVRKEVPPWSSVFYTHYSEPLHVIINEFNKDSVNIIGETLVKTLGAEYVGTPGTWEGGSYVISKFLKESGIGGNVEISDGSGLSRYNQVSPKVLATILSEAYNRSNFSYEFLSSLPVAGVDGTLKKRFRGSRIKGRVAAKTGYLNGVRALSGYVFAKDGNILVFSVISNGLGYKAKAFQNELLLQLIDCCN